jgi:hypothetical protein
MFWGPLGKQSDLSIGKVKFLGWDLYVPFFWQMDDGAKMFKYKRVQDQHYHIVKNFVFDKHLQHQFIMPEEFAASKRQFSELPLKDDKYKVYKVDEMKQMYV